MTNIPTTALRNAQKIKINTISENRKTINVVLLPALTGLRNFTKVQRSTGVPKYRKDPERRKKTRKDAKRPGKT